ncbi:hypothetical protein FJZ18_01570 [Candidatus Pacearchaeota archaeon]|nr:hypothetical protein [Candidatus Pacearchaeota archaeon]
MDHRHFNGTFFHLNEFWAAKVLNMKNNPAPGIDLLDEKVDLEVAFAKQSDEEYIHKSWRKLDHEMKWGERNKTTCWGLGFYYVKELD